MTMIVGCADGGRTEEEENFRKYCLQYRNTVAILAAEGHTTLQVPEIDLVSVSLPGEKQPVLARTPSRIEDGFPKEWFCRLRVNSKGLVAIPALGRQEGYLYLTRRGYEANRELILTAFENSPYCRAPEGTNLRDVFEAHANKHFNDIKLATDKMKAKFTKEENIGKLKELTAKTDAILIGTPACDIENKPDAGMDSPGR